MKVKVSMQQLNMGSKVKNLSESDWIIKKNLYSLKKKQKKNQKKFF